MPAFRPLSEVFLPVVVPVPQTGVRIFIWDARGDAGLSNASLPGSLVVVDFLDRPATCRDSDHHLSVDQELGEEGWKTIDRFANELHDNVFRYPSLLSKTESGLRDAVPILRGKSL